MSDEVKRMCGIETKPVAIEAFKALMQPMQHSTHTNHIPNAGEMVPPTQGMRG